MLLISRAPRKFGNLCMVLNRLIIREVGLCARVCGGDSYRVLISAEIVIGARARFENPPSCVRYRIEEDSFGCLKFICVCVF